MSSVNERRALLEQQLCSYHVSTESQGITRDEMLRLLRTTPACFERTCFPAHFTASAWVYCPSKKSALLVHHRKLNRWMQPGGHADGSPLLLAVAMREVQEETGLVSFTPGPGIFDLDIHKIPARGDQPEHWHYDVRFLFSVTNETPPVCSEESLDIRWVPLSDLNRYDTDESILRLARNCE